MSVELDSNHTQKIRAIKIRYKNINANYTETPDAMDRANSERRDGARMSTVLRAEPSPHLVTGDMGKNTAACRRGLRMPIIVELMKLVTKITIVA